MQIRHVGTGEEIASLPGDTLAGADLQGMVLRGADLRLTDLDRKSVV